MHEQETFKQYGNRSSDNQYFILTSLFAWHIGIRPTSGHHWHLSTCHMLAQNLVSRRRRNCQVSVAIRVTAYFTSVSDANLLPDRCFLRGSKKWEALGPIQPTGLVIGYGSIAVRLWTALPTAPISHPVTHITMAIWNSQYTTSPKREIVRWECSRIHKTVRKTQELNTSYYTGIEIG
jgi:hypothetical protein